MIVTRTPDAVDKLALLADATRFEPAGDSPQTETPPRRRRSQGDMDGVLSCVSHVTTPTGKKPVLKTMVTTACERNCYYCAFRAGRDSMRRVSFSPDEMARVYDQVQRAGVVEGIFLSSGIINGRVAAQDRIIDTIEILRRRYDYQGYVHLKIMPGAEYEQIRRAMQLADRVSVNLEGPTPSRLRALAPQKDFNAELLERLRWTHHIRQRERVRASVVTQFVVGAVGDSDLELLGLSQQLYQSLGLKRAYYSRFAPIIDTPFENLAAVDPLREQRLYQASFLLRDYGWDVEDLPFEGEGNLRLDVDPKRAWAEANLRSAPVDVMRASRLELLRVPGIGPRAADAILRARRLGRLTDLSHLRAIGAARVERAAPYILLDGRRPPQQLRLFP